MTRVLVPLAEGCEEMEAVIVIDTLRRAQWEVVVAGLKPGPVRASRGVVLVPDTTWDRIDAGSFDMIVVPGGSKGVDNLRADPRVLDAIRLLRGQDKITAAVCAGPLVLQEAGILDGRRATCHPGAASRMTAATRIDERVVVDGRIVTSQGAGTCFDFALAIVRMVDGESKAREVAEGMVF
jgi:protein deglycase